MASQPVPVTRQEWEKAVGLVLALSSGVLIGASYILKKKGLLESNALDGSTAGEGHAYLKNAKWWIGMCMMGLGEVFNFGAYAFLPAILVTPLGAISVVVGAVLASIFLKERLDFSGKIGCIQCVLGATIIVFHSPESNSTSTVADFFFFVVQPLFLVYTCIIFGTIFYLIRYVAPKYGDKHPICYISICSLVGSYLVLACQGFGSAVVYTAANWETGNQFLVWQIYPLFVFIILTVIMEINYLNKALNLFSTALVTPVYYVFFTGSTLITSSVLFQGFNQLDIIAGLTILVGFLVICGGVALLFHGFVQAENFSPLHVEGTIANLASPLPDTQSDILDEKSSPPLPPPPSSVHIGSNEIFRNESLKSRSHSSIKSFPNMTQTTSSDLKRITLDNHMSFFPNPITLQHQFSDIVTPTAQPCNQHFSVEMENRPSSSSFHPFIIAKSGDDILTSLEMADGARGEYLLKIDKNVES